MHLTSANMNGAGAMFLLWELSTPFVYARWFLHKAGMSRTTAYKINGVLMVLVFFLCRNVAGLGKKVSPSQHCKPFACTF